MDVLNFLKKIKETSSTNDKKSLLETVKDDIVLKEVLKLTVDPTFVSGYKKIVLPDVHTNELELKDSIELLKNNIYNRKLTGHAGRDFITDILSKSSENDSEVLIKVLTKNLDCGLQEKNINSVYGKTFIKDEPYMRCSLLDKKTIKNITSFKTHGYAISEIKYDGQYLNHIIVNSTLVSTSRNGIFYDFLGLKDLDMISLSNNIQKNDSRFSSGVVLMGEALVLDFDGSVLPRTTGNGIIQKAGKDTISSMEAQSVRFVLWDVVPYDAYLAGVWDVSREERRNILEKGISTLDSEYVKMATYRKVKTIKEAFEFNEEVMSTGAEGSILKCESGVWKSHTSTKQIKLKLKMEIDLRIVGFNEGDKKRKGMLGSLILESEDGIITVNCGTGFKEKDHEYTFKSIWEKRDLLLGTIVTISSNELTKDKNTNQISIFIPVFEEFRFDKNVADSYERILEIRQSAIEVFNKELTETFI